MVWLMGLGGWGVCRGGGRGDSGGGRGRVELGLDLDLRTRFLCLGMEAGISVAEIFRGGGIWFLIL